MIAREHIVLIILLMIFQSANGQTGNHLVDGVGFHYTFDDTNKLIVNYVEDRDLLKINKTSASFCISNFDGAKLNYGSSIPYHPNNDPVDLDKNLTRQSFIVRLNDDRWLTFYLVTMNKANESSKFQVYYRIARMQNGKFEYMNEPATQLIDKHTHSILHIPDTSGGFWLVTKHDTLQYTSYYFNQSTQPIRISTSNMSRNLAYTDIPSGKDYASPSGNLIISTRLGTQKLDSFGLNFEELKLLSFDKVKGNVMERNTLYQSIDTFWNREFRDKNRTAIRQGYATNAYEMSSNDKYTYLSINIGSDVLLRLNKLLQIDHITLDTKILRTVKENTTADTLADGSIGKYRSYDNLKLLNNRRLYLKKTLIYDNPDQTSYSVLDYIRNPNKAVSAIANNAVKSSDNRGDNGYPLSNTPYNYLIVKPSITKAECTTQVTFIDKCDYSLPDTKVTYYVEDIAGSGVLVPKGENPTLNFTRSGNYLCKVILKSHLGTYKEVWYDTLRIRIPPVADFEAADTLVCAYVPLEFSDESISDTVNAATGELWVWTFGDGETQTIFLPFGQDRGGDISVSHVYTTPGTYTVSFFYSNGFCDSTLVKNKYITVVDAPAPGFSIDDTAGCTPVTLTITDTITKNTTGKEYNYNDGRGWINIPVDQRNFSQTYTNAGAYWIVQRLYGYTNCVTQQDSIQVFLTPGFTEENSTHVALVSYQDVAAYPPQEEVVTVMWHTNKDTADSYEVYRNGKLIKELLADTGAYNSADDSLVLEREGLNYAVVALDSCGSKTRMGLLGKPIHVTGKVIGDNDMSIISHTGYEELLLGTREISYSLQTFEYGEWVELNSQNNTLDYEDPRFLNFVNEGLQLEKSYRVVGSTNISSDKTISNILRLPYKPILFLPTAFTPNGDNLNDIWIPVTFGVEHYEVDIYNRYGQKIIHFTEQEAGWAAEDIAIGAYMVIIRAKGTDNEWYNEKSTVTVIK